MSAYEIFMVIIGLAGIFISLLGIIIKLSLIYIDEKNSRPGSK